MKKEKIGMIDPNVLTKLTKSYMLKVAKACDIELDEVPLSMIVSVENEAINTIVKLEKHDLLKKGLKIIY